MGILAKTTPHQGSARCRQSIRATWFLALGCCGVALLAQAAIGQTSNANSDTGSANGMVEANSQAMEAASSQQDAGQSSYQSANQEELPKSKKAKVKGKTAKASVAPKQRRFDVILDRVVKSAAIAVKYDLSQRKIAITRMSLRRLETSHNLPRAVAKLVETNILEHMATVVSADMVDCRSCRARTAALVEGKLMIDAPAGNLARLDRSAEELNITHWLDAVLVLDKYSVSLGLQIFDTKSKAMVFSRTFNSASLKDRAARLASIERSIVLSRGREEYNTSFNFNFGFGGAALPNVAGTIQDSVMLTTQLRVTESIREKAGEFGILAAAFKTTSSVTKDYPTDTPAGESSKPKEKVIKATAKPYQQALSVQMLYAHLLYGDPNNVDQPRYYAHAGLGVLNAPGYLPPALRLGLDVYFGHLFVASAAGHYLGPTTVAVGGEDLSTKGGGGFEMLLGVRW